MLSVLFAPAALLAQDLRSGKLGGVCMVKAAPVTAVDAGNAGAAEDAGAAGSHCDLCGSFALVLPALLAQSLPVYAGLQSNGMDVPRKIAALVEGLPPSRGPPVL